MKAELAELKKLEKEKKKWESGKLATKCIVAEIDSSVIESGSVGGVLNKSKLINTSNVYSLSHLSPLLGFPNRSSCARIS